MSESGEWREVSSRAYTLLGLWPYGLALSVAFLASAALRDHEDPWMYPGSIAGIVIFGLIGLLRGR